MNTLTWGTHLQWGVQGERRWGPRAQGQEPRAQSGSNVVASSVKTFESGPHPPQQKKVKRKQNGGGGNIHLARRSCGCSTFRVLAWPLSPRAGLPGCGLPWEPEEPGPPSLLSRHLWAWGPGSCFDKLSRLTPPYVEVREPRGEQPGRRGCSCVLCAQDAGLVWPPRMGPGGV